MRSVFSKRNHCLMNWQIEFETWADSEKAVTESALGFKIKMA